MTILSVGNEARIVGTVQYYEAGGTWQVSDLKYDLMDPKNPNNVQRLGTGYEAAYVETDPETTPVEQSGCKGSVMSGMAVLAMAAACAVVLKKKR